jgi:hypothetical protein
MEIAVARKLAEHGLKLEVVRGIMNTPRLFSSKDNFDPWNPAQKAEAAGKRFFLDIFDPTTDKRRLIVYGVDQSQPPSQGNNDQSQSSGQDNAAGPVRNLDFEVRIIVDLTRIRERIRVLLS